MLTTIIGLLCLILLLAIFYMLFSMQRDKNETLSPETLQQTEARINARFAEIINNTASLNATQRQELSAAFSALTGKNDQQLTAVRNLVGEQLQTTLRTRFEESFKIVDNRLEEVRKGMKDVERLNENVTKFNKLLGNVKSRGTWGEVQLGNILSDMLSQNQYATNVMPNPNSKKIVEFAIKLPGSEENQPVYLPIDAKFPKEDYERLLVAENELDAENARKALIKAMSNFATQITAYITPPYTTDFAILFFPTEGLYIEALHDLGFMELMRQKKVMPSGPSTLPALINALQIGFKTLAVQKQTSQVWNILAKVKRDIGTYFEACDKLESKLSDAGTALNSARERIKQIENKLRSITAEEGYDENA